MRLQYPNSLLLSALLRLRQCDFILLFSTFLGKAFILLYKLSNYNRQRTNWPVHTVFWVRKMAHTFHVKLCVTELAEKHLRSHCSQSMAAEY